MFYIDRSSINIDNFTIVMFSRGFFISLHFSLLRTYVYQCILNIFWFTPNVLIRIPYIYLYVRIQTILNIMTFYYVSHINNVYVRTNGCLIICYVWLRMNNISLILIIIYSCKYRFYNSFWAKGDNIVHGCNYSWKSSFELISRYIYCINLHC